MNSLIVTGALREAGVVFEARGDGLRVAPAAKMTPELIALVREHKEDLLRIAHACAATGPPVEDTREFFEMARAILTPEGIDYGPAPVPPAPPEHDPLVHTETDKARGFRVVRERDLAKREREGLPPWIRVIEGGAS